MYRTDTPSALEAALHFLQRCHEFSTIEALNDAFAAVIGEFGFDTFAFVEVSAPRRAPNPRLVFGRSNPEWDANYAACRYHRIDPTVPHLDKNRAFSWSDIVGREPTAERRKMFGEAREMGAEDGLVIPVHGPQGGRQLVRLTTPANSIDPSIRPTLFAIAQVYASHGQTLIETGEEGAVTGGCPLTPRELQCVSLVIDGKSDWEIGAILGIKSHTAHTLLDRVKNKLNVRTRLQIALLAVQHGWLTDDLSPH